jgi:serine/threonine-protein kinase
MKNLLAKALLISISAGIAGVLLIILVDSFVVLYIVDVPTIKVPRLHALESTKAKTRLTQWGLNIVIGDSMHHEAIAIGAVVDQDPHAGRRVKQGRHITVTLSKGPRFYPAPNIGGISLRAARLQLESNQLRVGGILYVSSNKIPESAVISQSPRAGTPLARYTAVDLRISNGPASALKRVPNLVGVSIEAAEDTLKKYEMRLGRLQNRADNNHPIGTVLAQNPRADAQTVRYTQINIVVSARPVGDLNDNGDRP